MNEEEMNNDEISNTDKLDFYFKEKVEIHLILKREVSPGKKIYYNGFLIKRLSDRLWVLKEKELNEIEISISEIAPNGVSKFKRVER